MAKFETSYEYQFTDYIYGGLDMSLMVAMDFSLSNGAITDPKSLHYLPETESLAEIHK